MKIILIISVVLLLKGDVHSQVEQQWAARYNGPVSNDDRPFSIAVDRTGNVYVTGYSYGSGNNYDYLTVKYSPSGAEIWVQRYDNGISWGDFAYSNVLDSSGNLYVTGSSFVPTNSDIVTIKYSPSGVQQWLHRYNGPSGNLGDGGRVIRYDPEGFIYVGGNSSDTLTGEDFILLKYNLSGTLQWVSRFDGSGGGNHSDRVSCMVLDTSGNIYLGGRSRQHTPNWDYCIVKFSPQGIIQWSATYDGTAQNTDEIFSMAVDYSGNVYVTGESSGQYSDDFATLKYNNSGVQQWLHRYNGPGNGGDWGNSLVIDETNNVYVTGMSLTGMPPNFDFATIKYNTNGTIQWIKKYNEETPLYFDEAKSITRDTKNNIYVTGVSCTGGPSSTEDYLTIKYTPSGERLWLKRYDGEGLSDNPSIITVDSSGNVYVIGISVGNGTGNDFATVKYSQLVGLQPISNEIPAEFSLSQNYPNPFNPTTNFEFRIADFGFVNLTIYDAIGREVNMLVNGELKPGTYKADWDASNYPSGVYFYRLNAGDFNETKKMVLIK